MNAKLMKRFGAAVLAFVMLLGLLAGVLPPVSVAAAETTAEAFGVAFADPYAKVGQAMHLTVTGAASDITYSWSVDGEAVGTDATYTPTEDDLMKWIAVTVTSGSDSATAEMFFSELPVVYINTEGGQAITSKEYYINATLTVQGNEQYNSETTKLYDGATEIRGRGNSTWGQPKKPYRLKLDKKTDLLGMGKSKHWVLLANYMDESLQRNTLAYNLSGNMGMEHMETVFVDVILNGDFVGNYQLCENIRIDDTRVDIHDWESFAEDSAAVIAEAVGMDEDTAGDLEEYMVETDMSWITSGSFTFNGTTYNIADYPDIEIPSNNGGYLLELDEYYDEVSKFKTESGQPIMFKNPEFVNTNQDMIGFVQEYVQAFENAVHSDSYTAQYEGETVHYSDLYDFDALVDYWLISEIFFNEELNKKSTYMYKDIDELMMMGPIWDMDYSSGGEGQTYHTEQWATRYYNTNAQANQWYKYLIQDPYFFIKAQERYWEIRNVQVEDMLAELDSNYELLKVSAAANGERWGYGSSFEKYTNDLRNWFNNHLTWMDEQMATQESLRLSLGYHCSSRLALTLTDAAGNALAPFTADQVPADYIAKQGEDLKLEIVGGNNTDGTAALYVNSRRISETTTAANATTIVDVPASALTAELGKKNVIEIQIEKADGTINASRYVTVVTTATGEHEHSYEPVVTAPTCTEQGYTTYTCACGDSYVDESSYVDALGHTEVSAPDQEPTFDEPGLTGGTVCSVCGAVLAERTEIPQLNYNDGIIPLEVLTATAGDCHEGQAGEGPAELVMDDDFGTIWHTDWKGTSRENHWIQFEISGDYIVDGLRYKPRTKGSNGTITEYVIQISDDGVAFEDVTSGTWENNTNWKVVSFEKVQPKYVRLVARNTAGDNSQYVFASAAEIRLTGYKVGEEPVCQHKNTEIRDAQAPTCTEPGATGDTYCADCGEKLSAGEAIPAVGHTEEIIPGKAATCTEDGLTEGKKCSVCGGILVKQEVLPALGHDWKGTSCQRCDAKRENPFTDVPEDSFYINPVLWAVEKGITTGATETTFDPNGSCQRAQVVTFLWRAAGSPEPTSNENPFTDVPAGAFYYKAVLWAVEKGITNGLTETTFGPFALCNRAQVVTFLWRSQGSPASTAAVSFADVKEGQFYSVAVAWAVENEITNGLNATTFGVDAICNRAQVVTFLYRALAE